jgi:hypothetical protein
MLKLVYPPQFKIPDNLTIPQNLAKFQKGPGIQRFIRALGFTGHVNIIYEDNQVEALYYIDGSIDENKI